MHFTIKLTAWMILLAGLSACNRYDQSYQPTSQVSSSDTKIDGRGSEALNNSNSLLALVMASSKLAVSAEPYQAEIVFQEMKATAAEQLAAPKSTKSLIFTVAGPEVRLDMSGLPTGINGLVSVYIAQGGVPKFVAKRANTMFNGNVPQQIVIDECLVQRAPWDAGTHEGSCEWTVEEVN